MIKVMLKVRHPFLESEGMIKKSIFETKLLSYEKQQ